MARTALAYTPLTVNGSRTDPAGVAAVAGSGNGLSIPDVPPNRRQSAPEQTLLRLTCGASAGNAIVKAGSEPLGIASVQGDLTVPVPANGTVWLGPFESSRFIQPTGEMIVEVSQAMTVAAFLVARH